MVHKCDHTHSQTQQKVFSKIFKNITSFLIYLSRKWWKVNTYVLLEYNTELYELLFYCPPHFMQLFFFLLLICSI